MIVIQKKHSCGLTLYNLVSLPISEKVMLTWVHKELSDLGKKGVIICMLELLFSVTVLWEAMIL